MEKFYKLSVPNIKDRTRIDKYITMFIENASRARVQKAIDLGYVTVNGDIIKSNYLIKPFDEIDIELPVPEKMDIEPEDIPLNIVYEDNALIIVNKPAGMVTHPAYKNYSGTLVNAIMYHAQLRNEALSDMNGFVRAGIVHRLDKDTSGLLVIAKEEFAHKKLAEQFFNHTVKREYHAIIWGRLKEKSGTITTKIARDKINRKRMTVIPDAEEYGKLAITEYEVLEEFELMSLIKLHLRTGRTHQIRVHFSSIGHPVFGDDTYGGRKPHSVEITSTDKATINNLLEIMPRQALHAKVLGFIHPYTNEEIYFESELPDDMNAVLAKLRSL
jgi:23S rRNA pseudouridine1911/1915/1917 synthase